METTLSKIQKIGKSALGMNQFEEAMDLVSVEKPLEIRVRSNGNSAFKSIAVTMRTPGSDQSLVTGFLYTEGIVRELGHIISFTQKTEDIVEVILKQGYQDILDGMQRNFFTSSSCGICSKGSIDQIAIESNILPFTSTLRFSQNKILEIVQRTNQVKGIFNETGGCHSMTLFDSSGKDIAQQEDVGRHNAMDKLIGHSLLDGILNFNHYCIVVSGRLSFELVQKASMMGTAILIARGAPTSLAIEEASAQNICLIGFANSSRFNIYCGFERITNE